MADQLHGIRAKGKRRFKVTTDSKHDLPIAPNLLNREFTVAEPDKVWVGDIVIDALRMAWFKRHPGKDAGLIFHSDRGSQYASEDFRDVLTEYGITASMSRRGNCWDTPAARPCSAR